MKKGRGDRFKRNDLYEASTRKSYTDMKKIFKLLQVKDSSKKRHGSLPPCPSWKFWSQFGHTFQISQNVDCCKSLV